MASLIDLNRKIAKLQKQADAIKNRERKGIIAQIRQAIVDYELTPDDLFSANGAVIRRGRRPAGGRLGAASEEGSARPRRGRPVGSVSRKPVPIRYRDDEGREPVGAGVGGSGGRSCRGWPRHRGIPRQRRVLMDSARPA